MSGCGLRGADESMDQSVAINRCILLVTTNDGDDRYGNVRYGHDRHGDARHGDARAILSPMIMRIPSPLLQATLFTKPVAHQEVPRAHEWVEA